MVNGSVTMCFRLVDAASLMRRLHGESHVDVIVM